MGCIAQLETTVMAILDRLDHQHLSEYAQRSSRAESGKGNQKEGAQSFLQKAEGGRKRGRTLSSADSSDERQMEARPERKEIV